MGYHRLVTDFPCIELPSSTTRAKLLAIKNTLGIGGEYFQILKEITSEFSPRERHVILQMDEVHIRSDAFYKGGKIQGSIDNPNDPYNCIFNVGFEFNEKIFHHCTFNTTGVFFCCLPTPNS